MITCDLNCDMGEGIGNDKAIMPYITSANIACGYHAGDENTMRETIALATEAGVAIGAHPSFRDTEHFGRTEPKEISPAEVYQLVNEQINLLQRFALQGNAFVTHVKPHGALYNMAARNIGLATAVAKAVYDVHPSLTLFGLSGSYLISEGRKAGLKTVSEVFADRTYRDDGSLTPRTQPNALIRDENQSLQQVLQMIQQKTVTSTSGKAVPIVAETICLHGDGAHAVAYAKAIYHKLKEEGIGIQKP